MDKWLNDEQIVKIDLVDDSEKALEVWESQEHLRFLVFVVNLGVLGV